MTTIQPAEESQAKEFLGRVGRIQRRIKWKKAQVEQLRVLCPQALKIARELPFERRRVQARQRPQGLHPSAHRASASFVS